MNQNCSNNTNQNVIYQNQIYYTLPYGVQKNNYIKLGIQKTPDGQEFHIYQLNSGQKVAIAKSRELPIIKTLVNVGALNEEPDKSGISHLVEHSVFHGSKKYGDTIEKQFKDIGVVTNGATSYYRTEYEFQLGNNDEKNLKKAIDMHADMILNPMFSKLKKERSIVLKEGDEYRFDENNIFRSSLIKNLYSLNNHKTEEIICGDSDTINNIDEEDMFDFHKKYYRPDNIATVVISNKNPDEVIKYISESFTEACKGNFFNDTLSNKALTPNNSFQRRDYISKNNENGEIAFAFNIPGTIGHDEINNIKALLNLICCRNEYDIPPELFRASPQCLSIVFNFPLNSEQNENEELEKLKRAIEYVLLLPPTDSELKDIKKLLSDENKQNFFNNNATASTVLEELMYSPVINLSKNQQSIDGLNKERIQDAVKYFDLNKASISVLHPKGTTVEDIQKKFTEYSNRIPQTIIPKQATTLDISKSIKNYNISPYLQTSIKTVELPDNTNLVMTESKSDECTFTWQLYNPNTNTKNPALKMVFSEMMSAQPKILKIKQGENGYYNKVTAQPDKLNISFSCPSDSFIEAIKNSKVLFDIPFTKESFEQAKESALEEIKNIKETAYDKRDKDLFGYVNSKNIEELEKGIESLTLTDIKSYYNDIINNSYSTAVISAPFSKKPELLNQVASAINVSNFSFKKTDGNTYKNTYTNKTVSNCYLAKEEDKTPVYSQSYNFKITGNQEDQIKLELLKNVLGELLFNDLREEQGLCYTPSVGFNQYGNSGEILLEVTSSVSSQEEIKKIFDGFKNNINNLKTQNISESELNIAKNKLRIEMEGLFNNTEDAHYKIIKNMQTPSRLNIMQNTLAIIDKITVDDIRMAANYVFSGNPDYLVDANSQILKENRNYFETLGEIKE